MLFLFIVKVHSTEVLSSCGEALTNFRADPVAIMVDAQVDHLLASFFPNQTLDERDEVDRALATVGHDLFKIEAEMQTLEILIKDPEYAKVDLKDRLSQMKHQHEFYATILVALKARRAKVFRPVEN